MGRNNKLKEKEKNVTDNGKQITLELEEKGKGFHGKGKAERKGENMELEEKGRGRARGRGKADEKGNEKGRGKGTADEKGNEKGKCNQTWGPAKRAISLALQDIGVSQDFSTFLDGLTLGKVLNTLRKLVVIMARRASSTPEAIESKNEEETFPCGDKMTIVLMMKLNMKEIGGTMECSVCGHKYRVRIDWREGYLCLASYLLGKLYTVGWTPPSSDFTFECRTCYEKALPCPDDDKGNWNLLFVALTQSIELCSIDIIKGYLQEQHIEVPAETARLYFTFYMTMISQFDPTNEGWRWKVDSLAGAGDPIEERYKDHIERRPAIDQLVYCANSYKEAAISNDPKFDHIDVAENEKVEAPKKKVKKTNVPISELVYGGMVPADVQKAAEKEFEMALQDRVMEETKDKKNAVKAYVYDMRNKLNDKLHDFVTATEKEELITVHQTVEDWLYKDGEDETKGVYVAKLEELKKRGDPIEERYKDHTERGPAIDQLVYCVNSYKEAAISNDPKFDHIDIAEKQKVVNECVEAEAWLREKKQQQDSLPKYATPVLLSSDVKRKSEALDRFCRPVMTKPKPASKSQTPDTPSTPSPQGTDSHLGSAEKSKENTEDRNGNADSAAASTEPMNTDNPGTAPSPA